MAFVWYVLFLQTCSPALGEQPPVPQGALPKDEQPAESRPLFLASGEQAAVTQGTIPKEPKIAGSPPQVAKAFVPKYASVAVAPGKTAMPKSSIEPANTADKHTAEEDEVDPEEDDEDEDDEDEDDEEEDDAEERMMKKRRTRREAEWKREQMIEEANACHEKCAADASCHFKCPSPWEWEPMLKACQDYPAIKACHEMCKGTDCDECPKFEDEMINKMFAKDPQHAENLAEESCPMIEKAHACHEACKPADHECHHECSSKFHHGEHGHWPHHDEDEEEAEKRMMRMRKRRAAERKHKKQRGREADECFGCPGCDLRCVAEMLEKNKRKLGMNEKILRDFEKNKKLAEEALASGKDGLEIEVTHFVAPQAAMEPAPNWLTKIPLLAALMSFAGFLVYSAVFIGKIFHRGKRGQSGAQKASAHQDSEDFENALEMAMASTGCLEQLATPVVRKMAQSQEGPEACTNGWDNDFVAPCEAARGDATAENEGWSGVADQEGQTAPHDVDDDELKPKLQVKGKGD